MGVLDNTTITVDAILTKKGRELLAQGEGKFKITKFALADDEIDYGLYDITHPNGSNFYGQAIENMNLLEASPNQSLGVKYYLTNNISQAEGTAKVVTITGASSIKATRIGTFTADTSNSPNELYEFILSDTQYASITTVSDPKGEENVPREADTTYGGGGAGATGDSVIGSSVSIRCKPVSVLGGQDRQVVLTARGMDSGTTATITIDLLRN